jgi:hypothetical protein
MLDRQTDSDSPSCLGVIAQSYYERGYDMKDSPSGWVTGTLIEAGVAHREIWDTLGYLAQDQVSISDSEVA